MIASRAIGLHFFLLIQIVISQYFTFTTFSDWASSLVKDVIPDFEGLLVVLDPFGHHEAEEEREPEDEEIPRRVEVHKL